MNAIAGKLPVPEALSRQALKLLEGEVRRGLESKPRSLPAWLLYDAEGTSLFQQITLQPEYYPSCTEREILAAHASEIIESAARGERLTIVELGAGTAAKTCLLLEAAVQAQRTVIYRPVDVSATALKSAKKSLEAKLPGLRVVPQIADYTSKTLVRGSQEGRTLALNIGSSIGNFPPENAVEVLSNLRAQLAPGDALLLGVDLVKSEKTLWAAYNDAAGVTAAFNLNVLTRLNRELGANFDLAAFRHLAVWNEPESRIEMHLLCLKRQSIYFPDMDLKLELETGETIHTESSHKYTAERTLQLLQDSGFSPERAWTDAQGWFSVNLARARGAGPRGL